MSASKVSKALLYEVHEFCGHKIRVRKDGKMSATDACKAGDRDWYEYKRSKNTKLFLEELSAVPEISGTDLIESIQGGIPENQGTWVHPHVAIHLAQWISAKFAVKVVQWVGKFLEGDISHARETIERHGDITSQAEADEMKELRDKLYKLEIKAEEDKVIIIEKNNKINELCATVNSMNAKLDNLSLQNNTLLNQNGILLNQNTELLREAQDTNDNLEELKEYVVAQSVHRAHVPNDDAKREVLIIFRTGDREWNYYISRVKESGVRRAIARVRGQFPGSVEIYKVQYVPNARHLLEEIEEFFGDQMVRRACRIRLSNLVEAEFLRIVKRIYLEYIAQANNAIEEDE